MFSVRNMFFLGWGYWPFSIPTGFESDGWPLLPRLERVCLYDVLRPGVSFDVVGWISVSGTEQAAALYRLHAAQCIDLAQRSTDPQSRLALFDMARSWRMLADQADKNSQTVIPVYETPEPRQHVAQQQQQPQPDDEKEE
jgi:hypothetical protein